MAEFVDTHLDSIMTAALAVFLVCAIVVWTAHAWAMHAEFKRYQRKQQAFRERLRILAGEDR